MNIVQVKMHYFAKGNARAGCTESVPGGVTQPAFQKLGESENVYLCPCCMSVKQSSEISNLTSIINELHSAVTALTATIKSFQSSITNQSSPDTSHQLSSDISNNSSSQQEPLPNKVNKVEQVPSDCKFNVVIILYRIKECSKETSRSERLSHDLEQVTSVVSAGEHSINSLSIRDLLRLGKFQELFSKPCAILVKLNCTIDVSLLLQITS